MALEYLLAFKDGLIIGAAPSLLFLGGQLTLNNFMRSRAEMVREIHKAVIDVGGRLKELFKKDMQNDVSKRKLETGGGVGHPDGDWPPAAAVAALKKALPPNVKLRGFRCDDGRWIAECSADVSYTSSDVCGRRPVACPDARARPQGGGGAGGQKARPARRRRAVQPGLTL